MELVSQRLCAFGFYECKNIDFLGEKELKAFGFEPKNTVKIKNAMAQGWDYLRPTLLPALLKNAEFNARHGQQDVALFETTRTFSLTKGFPTETYTVAGVLNGALPSEPFFAPNGQKTDVYLLKGIVQELLAGFDGVQLVPSEKAPVYMHPKICIDIVINGKKAGVLGALHPLTLKTAGLKTAEMWAFELALKPLEKVFSAQDFTPAKAVAAFPPSLRDLSVVVDKNTSYAQIKTVLEQTALLVALQFDLIDVYEGEHLPQGKKSVTFTLAFSAPDRTLKDKEIDDAFNCLVNALKEKLGAELR